MFRKTLWYFVIIEATYLMKIAFGCVALKVWFDIDTRDSLAGGNIITGIIAWVIFEGILGSFIHIITKIWLYLEKRRRIDKRRKGTLGRI